MSNRDSLGFGDLLPQDVVDIFAQEKLNKKGRKQRSRSLGRALGWLKGKKKKTVANKEKNPGLGPAFDLALDRHPAGYQGSPKGAQKSGKQGHQQGNSLAVPKRDDSDEKTPEPLVLQENVFIEVSRPKYLEDLHSEAQEGLKLMQQEERIIGPEYQDNESTISTVSLRAEVDGGGFTTDSTIPDTTSTVSSVSSRSSRSGLTRQGSTFRPLNSGKKSDKGRMRRRHRRTIGGIPQHLQREFGLDRAEWTVSPQFEEEFVNGDSDIPQLAVHSPSEENNTDLIHSLTSVHNKQLNAAQTVHVDDMVLLQRLGSAQSEGDRPWSLAVPGMTTAGSGQPGPPSPVMSMSPQAAYLSKIIPNAVLPPSIEVVEISRGSSRNSVRTVSKSSLVLSSPSSSRASSRASIARSTTSKSSTITSASRHNHFHLSDSSCWSNSDSDTLVSDSSTVSSSSTPRQRDTSASKKQNKVSDSPKYPSNGKIIKGNESKKDGPFVRSLSVMKPKRAPPPPSRSYSLHNKMKRRSRDLADVKITPSQTNEGNMKKIIDSPGYNADTSSLDESPGSKTPSPLKPQQNVDSTQNNVSADASNAKKEALPVSNNSKIVSPSSGYSSQDATSPKNPSPKHKKGLLAKLHKLFPAATTEDLSTSAQPVANETSSATVSTVSDKPSVKTLKELFTIPPHPKVHAPPPPPPEVWSQSTRSIELLLGPPASGNTYAIVKKNPKDKRPYRPAASASSEGNMRGEEQKQANGITVESKKVHISQVHTSQEGSLNVVNRRNDCERLIQKNVDVKEHGKVQVSEILNSVLVRNVDRNTDRLPAIAEEHKTITQNTVNPSISSAHISPRLPTKPTADVRTVVSVHVASPESSWPPPPPPISQAGLGSPDETDFPLPPPPIFTEAGIVLPVQVPLDKPVPAASDVSTSLQGNKAPPLNIPPPPPYTAPPPPIKLYAISEKVKLFSPQSKDVSLPPSTITSSPSKEAVTARTISKPSPEAPSPKKISHATTETLPSTPPPAQKLPAIPPPSEAPPSQKLLVDIVPTKITHAPSTKPPVLPPNSDVLPPPDLIPPAPSKEVVVVPSIVADLPTPPPSQVSTLLQKEVTAPAEEVISEPTEASSTQSVVTNLNCPTKVFIPAPKDIPSPPSIVSKPPSEDLSPHDPSDALSPAKASPSSPPPSTEVMTPPTEVTLIPPEVSNPRPEEVSTLPQTEVTQSPIEIPTPPEISSPPPEEVSTPPQTEVTQSPVEIPSPPDVSIPKPEDVSQPSVQELSRPQEVSPPIEMSVQSVKDQSPQTPAEVHSEAPPSPKDVSPPIHVLSPPLEVAPASPEEIHPSPKETSSPEIVVVEAAEPQVTEELPPVVEDERFLPVVVEVSYPELSEETSTDAVEEALEDSQKPPEVKETSPAAEVLNISSSEKSDPNPQKEIKLSEEEILNETDSSLPPWKSILIPPQSIPPPPPIEQTTSDILPSHEPEKPEEIPSQPEAQKPDEIPTEAEAQKPDEIPSEAEAQKLDEIPSQPEAQKLDEIPSEAEAQKLDEIPSEAEAQKLDEIPSQPEAQKPDEIPTEAEAQKSDEIPSQPEVPPSESSPQEEADANVVLSSPIEEVPKQAPATDTTEQQSKEPPHSLIAGEVSQNANSTHDQAINGSPESPKTKDEAKPKDKAETTSQATAEAPQKPIRRSLVSPPTSPPATVTTEPPPLKGSSPNTAVPTTTTKSPPAMAPSMNLQEAIRLRTAARSHNSPSSRLGIHSPPGFDVRKSPTSTASFIFSKSSKKVVIETRSEAKVDKKTEGPVTKASAEQTTKKEFKVPPPVAKKPKPKSKEAESGDNEQTAGQDAHSDTIRDNAQKPNGTARTVEGH